MPTAIVLFTRDLRVHDHPALAAGAAAAAVVPAFVFDDAILKGAFNALNRPPLTGGHGGRRDRGA